jgi:hypothetical protein
MNVSGDGMPLNKGNVIFTLGSASYPSFKGAIQETFGKSLAEIADTNAESGFQALGVGIRAVTGRYRKNRFIRINAGKVSLDMSSGEDSQEALDLVVSNSTDRLVSNLMERFIEKGVDGQAVVIKEPGYIRKKLGALPVAETIAIFRISDFLEET